MKISFSKLLLLFVLVPFIELFILLRIADLTSPLATFALIIITGVVGAYFAKQQGRKVVAAINRDINAGKMPADSMVNGICVLAGGIMLLTPGILTDILGFTLVLPLTRPLLAAWLKGKFSGLISSGNVRVYQSDNIYNTAQYRPPVDDADIVVVDEDDE